MYAKGIKCIFVIYTMTKKITLLIRKTSNQGYNITHKTKIMKDINIWVQLLHYECPQIQNKSGFKISITQLLLIFT